MVIPTILGQLRSELNTSSNMAHQSQGGPTAYVTSFSPEPDIKDPVDNTPSDVQPPGVDDEPQSLEEALLGE